MSKPDPSGAPMLNAPTFRRDEAAWYGLAVVLVVPFVNSFALWRWLDARLPAVALTAIPFILASPIVLWAVARLHRGVPRARLPWIALALAFWLNVWSVRQVNIPPAWLVIQSLELKGSPL